MELEPESESESEQLAKRIAQLERAVDVALRWDGDDRAAVLEVEADVMEQESRDIFDAAHGSDFAKWEAYAQHAIRLRIAAEVLRDRLGK